MSTRNAILYGMVLVPGALLLYRYPTWQTGLGLFIAAAIFQTLVISKSTVIAIAGGFPHVTRSRFSVLTLKQVSHQAFEKKIRGPVPSPAFLPHAVHGFPKCASHVRRINSSYHRFRRTLTCSLMDLATLPAREIAIRSGLCAPAPFGTRSGRPTASHRSPRARRSTIAIAHGRRGTRSRCRCRHRGCRR